MHAALLNLALVLAPAGGEATSNTPDLFAFYSAGMEQVLADPRDGGLLGMIQNLEPMIRSLASQGEAPVPPAVFLAARWLDRPFSLHGGVSAKGLPNLQFDIAWDDRAEARKEFADLRKSLEGAGIVLAASDADAGSMTTMTPVGSLSAKLIDKDKGSTLSITLGRARGPILEVPSYSLPSGVRPAFVANWDGAQLTSVLDANMTSAEDLKVRRLLGTLGLAGRDALELSFSMGHGKAEAITTMHVKGWSESFFGEAMSRHLTQRDLGMLPADTLWAWMGNFEPARLFDLAREIDEKEVDQGLGMAKQILGLDLEADLFDKLGPVLGAYSSRSTGGAGGPTGLVFFAECREPKLVLGTLQRLVALAEMQTQQKIRSTAWNHGDYKCTSFAMPGSAMPVEPCVATTSDRILLTLSRSALTEALDQLGRDESILDHARIDELPEAALQNLVAFSFYDAPYGLERGYSTIGMLQSSMSNLMAGAGADVDLSALPNFASLIPPYSQLARGTRPTVALTYMRNGDLLQATTHDRSMLARMTAGAGSPMSAGGPASLAIVSSIAIPKLMSARMAANETAAIANLRSLVSAQAQFKAATVVDTNQNGNGEYGTLGELAGARPLRGSDAPVQPAILSPTFGQLVDDGCRGTVVQKSGYWFQLWIPGPDGSMVCDLPDGKSSAMWRPDPKQGEVRWFAYAWPVDPGTTGNRSFFVNEAGDIYAFTHDGRSFYGGTCAEGGTQPRSEAIFAHGTRWRLPAYGTPSSDGNLWQPIF